MGYLRTESALTASQNYVKYYYMVRNPKIFLFIFVILYRPTLLTIRFDDFEDFVWLATGPPFMLHIYLFQYWTAAYTEACLSLSQGNEMNIMNVTCVVCFFQFVIVFPWPFNIVYTPCLFYFQWYHDHNVVAKSYSEISLQHH